MTPKQSKRREPSELIRLRIESLAGGGEGVGHVSSAAGERRAVFVARTAPGDLVEVMADFKTRPARAQLRQIVESSLQRVTPACPVANQCGGCDWMHLSLTAQVQAHADLASAALEREHVIRPPIRTHEPTATQHYRTRARLHVKADGRTTRLGYREKCSHQIVDVRSCVVLDPRLEALLAPVSTLFDREEGRGDLAIAVGTAQRPVLDLRWDGMLSGAFFRNLDLGRSRGLWSGAAIRLAGSRRPAVIGDPRVVTTAADGGPLIAPSAGFAQANPDTSRKLGERALELMQDWGAGELLELFAGSGNFSVLLARKAKSLTVVEADADAVACARKNLAERSLTARLIAADATDCPIASSITQVWLDPPREGARAAVEAVVRSRVRCVAYVSCNPAALARDLRILEVGGFQTVALETFEMFPHTSHVETLAVLRRERSAVGISRRSVEPTLAAQDARCTVADDARARRGHGQPRTRK